MEDDKRRQPNDLTSIYVKGNNQSSSIIKHSAIEETVVKRTNHFIKFRAATINSNVNGWAW